MPETAKLKMQLVLTICSISLGVGFSFPQLLYYSAQYTYSICLQ